MRKILFSLLITVFMISAALILTQCELILGNGQNANVVIYLGNSPGAPGARDLGLTQTFSSIKITVTGAGMSTITQAITNHPASISLSVPVGTDRRFTVEAFLGSPVVSPFDKYPHLVSLKGRASATLTAGQNTVTVKMVAGATQLLVPDYNNHTIFYADDISSFSTDFKGDLGFANLFPPTSYVYFYPSDLDIASNGVIFAANGAYDMNGVIMADSVVGNQPSLTPYTPIAGQQITALAMDRNANFDADGNGSIDTNILYFYSSYMYQLSFAVIDGSPPYTPHTIDISSTNLIPQGMAVDPWTHHLYLVGRLMDSNTTEIIEYDPILNIVDQTLIFASDGYQSLQDVIVKDDAIFVLNEVSVYAPIPTAFPIVIKYDKNLSNPQGYGIMSYDALNQMFIESYAPGDFYHPKRFLAQENDGLYILDDAPGLDKIVYINTDFSGWRTFPAAPPYSTTGFFQFFEIPLK